MMKLATALLAVAVSAKVVPHDDDAASEFDDKCFHCIDEGYVFCSDTVFNGDKGKCYDTSCTEDQLQGDDRKAAAGTCT